MSQSAVLEIRGLRVSFRPDAFKPAQHILRGVSAKFYAGRCTGVLGHNGAGKTTTIRTILGLINPDQGDVLFHGNPLAIEDKRTIGYMPEVNKLAGGLTPVELLHMHLRLMAPQLPKAKRKEMIDATLAKIGLKSHATKKIRRLSKGQGRRAAWALATIHEPSLLILDEPFSGLDPLGRKHMYDWITAEKARGCTILLCTHELRQVNTLCDDYHVFNRGQVVLSTCKETSEDKLTSQAASWHFDYNLHISGVDEDQLREVFKKESLPPWQALRQDGYLAAIGFHEYEHAAQWFAALHRLGIVVVRFGDQAFFGEEELMPYFETGDA